MRPSIEPDQPDRQPAPQPATQPDGQPGGRPDGRLDDQGDGTASRPRRMDRGILKPFRSLLSAQVVGAGLGLVFWITVARLVPAHDVGVAAAAISAQTLLGVVTNLGLGTLLIAELPLHDPRRQRRLILRSLMVVATVAVVLAGLVAALSPLLSSNLREALGDPVGAGAFVLGVVGASCAVIADEATLPLGRSGVQVTRNLLASSLRFPVTVLLLVLGFTDSHVLQICWVLPILVSVPFALWRLRLPRGAAAEPTLLQDLRTYAGAAFHNQALNLSIAAGSQLVPVVAGLTLVSVENAEFTIAWLMASFVFLPPYLLAIALFAHGANVSTEEFRASMQTTLPAALLLSLALCAGAWLLGEPVLLVFGGDYSDASYQILALLVPAGFWMVFKDHLVALWRSQRRFTLATRLASGALVLELAGATAGAMVGGARGLCLGWLAAMVIEILVAVPWLRQAFGGLSWHLPTRLPARSESGRVSLAVVAAVTLVLTVAVVGLVTSVRGGGGGGADADPSASRTVACEPTAQRPGPLVDLGVQAATGDPDHPLLSVGQVDSLVTLAAQAGASVISTSAQWRVLEPRRGQAYDFSGLDRVVDAARRQGLQVRVQLGGVPTWAQDGVPTDTDWRPPLSQPELERWSTFVTDTLQHLRGRVDYVEAWVEPDNQAFWSTGPDPVAFARLLATTYDAVKAVDPAVQVVSGSLAGNDVGYLEKLYAAVDELGRDTRPFDAVGVHPFTGDLTPQEMAPGRRYDKAPFGTYDENFAGFRELHQVMAEQGDDALPIYIGEFGYSTRAMGTARAVPDDVRAGYLTEAFKAATCSPYVEALSWYYLHPTPWNPGSWTLVDADLRPNATYAALQQWSASVRAVTGD